MRILVDTNVVLDVLLKREPFYQSAKRVLELAQYAEIEEYVSASAITDIYYIANRALRDIVVVRNLLVQLFGIVGIASVSGREIRFALDLGWNDFEDAVQYSAALSARMDAVVTRDSSGYRLAQIPAYQPEQFLKMIIPDAGT